MRRLLTMGYIDTQMIITKLANAAYTLPNPDVWENNFSEMSTIIKGIAIKQPIA